MKQYQISYRDPGSFGSTLARIRRACDGMSYGSVLFYITWAEEARAGLRDVTEAIGRYFPESFYYGNEASGNIAMGAFSLGIHVTCYVFEAADAKTELVWVEEGTRYASLEDLWAYCRTREGLRAVELIPTMSYIETLKIDGSVPALGGDILLFGGASVNYDDPGYDADIIASGHPQTKDGMAVVLYYGKEFVFSSASVLGWKGLGRQMEVTDSTGKCIREIDGSPAYAVYEKYLNLTVEDRDTLVFPLIAEEDGNEYIRTPQTVLPDKSMRMFADIPKGTKVRIAYGDKNTILSSVYGAAKEIADFRPEAIRVYSCAARLLFWGRDEVSKETLPLQEIAPVCGFYTGGEILRFGEKLRVLNSTLAIVCLREGEADPHRAAGRVSRSEDKSLISRLTYFTEKIVEEEKAQRMLAESFEKVLSAEYQVMYYIDIRGGRASFLHGDEEAKKFVPIFNADSAEAMFANFRRYYVDTAVAEEDRERVLSVMNAPNILNVLKHSNSVSVNYRVRRNLVDPVYTEMRMMKAGEENGELTAAILAFRMSDEELRTALEVQEKLREDAQMIGGLASGYHTLYYVNLDEQTIRIYSLDGERYPELRPIAADSRDPVGVLRSFGTSDLVHPDDRKLFAPLTADTVRELLAHTKKYTVRFRRNYSGVYRWLEMDIVKYEDADERANAVAVGFADRDREIRAEREQQRRLEEALRSAEVANRSKSSFLFNMSHDIRTPMNAIKGFTAMAKKYAGDTDKVRDYLDKIDISGQQLITLINQVLEMSRIESGRIGFDEKPVDIRERFSSMVTVVEAQARLKGLDFHASLENVTHFRVLADDSRMGQIALNVAGNAIKYTPEGGRVDFVLKEIPPRKSGCATMVFTVKDTGIGMSPEFLDRLFEPFSRENNTTVSGIQGTGLGMSIVKNLVDLKEGSIAVASKPGEGTRFDITLDFIIDAENAEAPAPAEKKTDPGSFAGRRILLVEDNEMNREIARDMLDEYGFIVEEAEDGSVAAEKCRAAAQRGEYGYYDLILMDIQMPVMNGYDATRAIRAIPVPDGTRIPIIAMTANAFEEDRRNAFAAGMDEHLAKPIDARGLLEMLSRFL